MEFDEYCLHYDRFHEEFFPSATTKDKEEKLKEEIFEFMTAKMFGTRNEKIAEAIDVMNTSIAYLRAEGIVNPLWDGFLKLEKTAIKYRGDKNAI